MHKSVPNILFIMCDQLRWDYLSCAGHPTLQTPNIDRLATEGVRFTEAFCQAPLCGPSRASFYTGRYMSSHGSMSNDDPLKASELTLGDYLRPMGYRTALVGKTHTSVSTVGLKRLGMVEDSEAALALACGGFEPYEIYEGLYPDQILPLNLGYNAFLRRNGFDGVNPWRQYVATNVSADGTLLDGWLLRNNAWPANIPEEYSETAFATQRAMEFIENADEQPWCLHLGYIKPHWPLVAPAPYHNLYGAEDIPPVVRSESEKQDRHPVVEAFARQEYSVNYSRDEVRDKVVPVYMGLIKQLDDQLGKLFDYLSENDLRNDTVVIFTSDHGDYLGDHWLGEKDLLHDCSARIPMIIYDPRPQADETRGTLCDVFVESVDLIPSLVDVAGGEPCMERMEGRSMMPLVHKIHNGDPLNPSAQARAFVVSEIDYSDRGPRTLLDVPPYNCRAMMLRTREWKYIFYQGFRPQLFDLMADPYELEDLGASAEYRQHCNDMHEMLFNWLQTRKSRTEVPYDTVTQSGPELDEKYGIVIGRW